MKLGVLINSEEALIKVIKANLPVKIAYQLNKEFNKVEPDVKFFNNKRNELLLKYGKREGDIVTISDEENKNKFIQEIQEAHDIEISDFTKIKLKVLEDANLELSANDINLLSWLIEE